MIVRHSCAKSCAKSYCRIALFTMKAARQRAAARGGCETSTPGSVLVLNAELVALRILQHDRLFTDADHSRSEPYETFDLGIDRTRRT